MHLPPPVRLPSGCRQPLIRHLRQERKRWPPPGRCLSIHLSHRYGDINSRRPIEAGRDVSELRRVRLDLQAVRVAADVRLLTIRTDSLLTPLARAYGPVESPTPDSGGNLMTRAAHPFNRMIAVVCLTLMVVPLGASAASAFGYRDTGFDPDDRRPVGFDPDIRSTTRRVWETVDGQRVLTIKFRAYEDLGVYWFVNVHLDSRGGPRWDYVMRLRNEDMSGKGCSLTKRGDPGSSLAGRFHQGHTDAAWC